MSARTPTPAQPIDEPIVPPVSFGEAAEWLTEASKRHAKNRAQPELRRTGLTKGICLQLAELLNVWHLAGAGTTASVPEPVAEPTDDMPSGLEVVTDPLAELHAAQARQAEVTERHATWLGPTTADHHTHEFTFGTPAPVERWHDQLDGFAPFGPPEYQIGDKVTVGGTEFVKHSNDPFPQPTSVPGIDGTLIPALGIADTITPPAPDLTYYRMFSAPAPILTDALVEPHGTGISQVVTLRPDEPAASGHYAPGTEPTNGVTVPKADAGNWSARATWFTDSLFPVAAEPLVLPFYSYSLVSAMNKCPMSVRLERFDRDDNGERLPQLPAWWNAGGTAFHETIRQWETNRAQPGPDSYVVSADETAASWREHFETQITGITQETGIDPSQWKAADKGRQNREWWLDKGPEMAARYVEARSPEYEILQLDKGTLALELGLTTPPHVFGAPVKMYVDQVLWYPKTNDVEIRDLKTGSRMPMDPLQIDTYAAGLVASGLLPKDRRTLYGSMWNARQGEPTWSRVIDADALTQAEYRYKSVVTAIARREFEPRPTALCGSCSVRKYCPIMGDEGTKRPLKLPDSEITVTKHALDVSVMSD